MHLLMLPLLMPIRRRNKMCGFIGFWWLHSEKLDNPKAGRPLTLSITNLHLATKPLSQFNHPAIKRRNARFQTNGHGNAVYLAQNAIWQINDAIGIHHTQLVLYHYLFGQWVGKKAQRPTKAGFDTPVGQRLCNGAESFWMESITMKLVCGWC